MPIAFRNIVGILAALILTIAIEVIVILFFKKRSKKLIITSVIVNFVTNVIMNVLLTYVFHDNYIFYLVVFEVIIFVIEACAYQVILKHYKDSFIISLACNSASLGVVIAMRIIFQSNIVHNTILWLMFILTSLVTGIFQLQPTYGEITSIHFYTMDYEEIPGVFIQDYVLEDYDYQATHLMSGRTVLNSPSPIHTYYTIEADEGDSFIVRFSIELERADDSLESLYINHVDYDVDELYAFSRDGTGITAEICYENLTTDVLGADMYHVSYANIHVDGETESERIYLHMIGHSDVVGYCFFFGDISDLAYQNNRMT